MRLGNKVKCTAYVKKRRLTGVFFDEAHKNKFESDRGFVVDNFVLLTEQDDREFNQDLFDVRNCDFIGIVIGFIKKPTSIFYYDFKEESRLYADAVGFSYKKGENDPPVGVLKCGYELFYKVAFRMNQVRLVNANDIEILE